MLISTEEFEESLCRLAPVSLDNYRVIRYRGDDISVPISCFSAGDRDRLRTLYATLRQLFENLSAQSPSNTGAYLETFLDACRPEDLARMAQEIGRETCAQKATAELAKAIHDVRGGGLTPLLGLLELAASGDTDLEMANLLFYLTRDHLKIMRNVLLGLDDARREEDLRPKPHGTDLIVEKWHETVLHEEGRQARLLVDCRETCTIGVCCMEFGALDRILYNLINNACRHTVDEVMRLVIFPVPDGDGRNLRFVLLNRVSPEDHHRLATANLGELFRAGTSTTGSGLGLAIVSEFVSNAFGLPNSGDAVRLGYVGASLLGDTFAAWFHWPRAGSYDLRLRPTAA